MRLKRTVSVILAIALLASLIPVGVMALRGAAANPDPTYNRAPAPEVAILNDCTGNNSAFYESVQGSGKYNAVEAGYFGDLRYDTKIKTVTYYAWSDFGSSAIKALRDENDEIKIGYSVTRTSSTHKHSAGIWEYRVTSYSNTCLGYNTTGLVGYGLVHYSGYNRNMDRDRYGKNEFHSFTPQDSSLDLAFDQSRVTYNNGSGLCTCGGTSEGCMVCFYDGTAPNIEALQILDGNGEYCREFKPGQQINIVLTCSEPIRFADDSKIGKGEVYIGAKTSAAAADPLYFHLTSLDWDTLTFTYDVPQGYTAIFDGVSIDLTAAPSDGTALLNSGKTIELKQLNADGPFAVTVPSGQEALGYTEASSPVTDLAGNSLRLAYGDPSQIHRRFFIDGQSPFVAMVDMTADTNNGAIKDALGKQLGDLNYRDASDFSLGVGDSLSVKAYLNEVAYGGTVTFTTNIRKSDGSYLSFSGSANRWDTVLTGDVEMGPEYGLGSSNGYVSAVICGSAAIEAGMAVDDDGRIKITKVQYSDVTDRAGNTVNSTVT